MKVYYITGACLIFLILIYVIWFAKREWNENKNVRNHNKQRKLIKSNTMSEVKKTEEKTTEKYNPAGKYTPDEFIKISNNMINNGGGFVKYIGKAMIYADAENREILTRAFPKYFDEYLKIND